MPPGTDTNATQDARDSGRGEFFHVRCSEDLKKDVRAAAGARNQDMSEYIRDVLADAARSDQ